MPTDTERLNFLDTLECGFRHEGYGDYSYYSGPDWRNGLPKQDVRYVIDRAMAEMGWKPEVPSGGTSP